MTTEERNAIREKLLAIRKNGALLNEIYRTDRNEGKTPAETVRRMISEIGKHDTEAILSSLVRDKYWDGRLSSTAKTWACHIDHNIPQIYNYMNADVIHPAHLCQLAEEMAKA